MGFFDRFSNKKPAPAAARPAEPAPEGAPNPAAGAGVKPRLATARERLEAKDLPGALAIYEEVLAAAGDRADVLVAISGDLGSHGHVAEIIEHIAPRYDAERHGPATGLNILQAYLAVRNADAAQHVLDILFTLQRPELEERLHGFSNAIAELMVETGGGLEAGGAPAAAPKVAMISISKPIWFYGLEPLEEKILPARSDRPRRIAFGQLAVLGIQDVAEAMRRPEDETGRLSRALPLWFAETFAFCPHYAPIAAVGLVQRPAEPSHHVIFGAEWTTENLRQVVDSVDGGLDYVFTGAIRARADDFELVLRLWEIRKYRERKTFTARWTPASADAELAKLHEQVRAFMEWSAPAGAEFAYAPPAKPRAWLDTINTSLGLFLVDKGLLPKEQLGAIETALAQAAQRAPDDIAGSLAFLTTRARAAKLGFGPAPEAKLAENPLVAQARQLA